MKLGHTAIHTTNLERLRAFYETYFAAAAQPVYHNPRTGLVMQYMRFPDGGAMLELMQWPDIAAQSPVPEAGHPAGYAHIAILLPDIPAVDALTTRLQQDGYTVVSGPRHTGDGQYESCVLDPDGNAVELVAELHLS